MAEGEQERFELLNSLIEVHGEDVARKLMDSLPPFSWDQVATKDDLNALATAITAKFDQVDAEFVRLRGEISKVEGNLSKEIAGLSIKIGELDSKFSTKIGELDSKISTKIGELDSKIGKLDSSFSKKITEQTRVMVLTMAGFSVTVCAAMAGGILFA